MVGSVPRDFTEMVSMGIQLEEGVREGRLTKGNESTSSIKKFGGHLPKKKEQEVGMMAFGGPQQNYPAYQHIAAITPSTNITQPQYPHQYPQHQYPQPQHPHQYPQHQYPQPQYPQQQPYQQPQQQPYQQPYQQPKRQQQPRQQAPRKKFDPIPITYEQLLPTLLRKEVVQTRAPSAIPEKLPPWYRHDRFCSFHQGSPGHSTEDCFSIKKAVQNLMRQKNKLHRPKSKCSNQSTAK